MMVPNEIVRRLLEARERWIVAAPMSDEEMEAGGDAMDAIEDLWVVVFDTAAAADPDPKDGDGADR